MGTGQVVCRVPCGALAVVSPGCPPATWRAARPPRAPAVSCSGRSRAAHRLRPGGGPRPRGRDEHDPWVLRMRTKPRSLAERMRVGMLHAACLLGCATDSPVCCTKALALRTATTWHLRDHAPYMCGTTQTERLGLSDPLHPYRVLRNLVYLVHGGQSHEGTEANHDEERASDAGDHGAASAMRSWISEVGRPSRAGVRDGLNNGSQRCPVPLVRREAGG